jgi:hypothetical protein
MFDKSYLINSLYMLKVTNTIIAMKLIKFYKIFSKNNDY